MRELRGIEQDQENETHQNQNVATDLQKKVNLM
jgi:hypothetical protein